MSDGWETIYPKPEPVSTESEIELVGGPLDGTRMMVSDVDRPLVGPTLSHSEAGDPVVVGEGLVYRRRIIGDDEPEPMPIRFDYLRPACSVA